MLIIIISWPIALTFHNGEKVLIRCKEFSLQGGLMHLDRIILAFLREYREADLPSCSRPEVYLLKKGL
jgi:hypothetical protein